MSAQNKTFYVTTPIYYVTAKPHLGSLYSTVLADIAARWHQLRGCQTFLLTGTDEHGQKVAEAAGHVKQPTKAFVDSFIAPYQEVWKAYQISYNRFIRTTDTDHIEAVQEWVRMLQEKGDIYKGVYTGFYCTPCETFVTEKAEGQTTPVCPSCGRSTQQIAEACYFFRLSAYQDRLLDWYRTHPDWIVPTDRINEVRAFVEGGLRDLAISRLRTTVSWGIPFPGDAAHVIYVWADALHNYLSGVGYGNHKGAQEFAHWWPAQLQVLGKDIIRFHAVYWPAFLMAAGLDLPQKLLVHGWIKIGDAKMSKSLGNVIDPLLLWERYGADAVRYYCARYLAITHDAPFSIDDLELRINTDLANDLGNLLSRITALALGRNCPSVSLPSILREREQELAMQMAQLLQEVIRDMEDCLFHRAYSLIWRMVALVNSYFHEQQPWKLSRPEDKDRFATIIAMAAHMLSVIGFISWPVMPQAMEQLLSQLGLSREAMQQKFLEHGFGIPAKATFKFTKGAPLFAKSEREKSSEKVSHALVEGQGVRPEAFISFDDFAKVDLLVGTITQVEVVPQSDKLYKLTVDLGVQGMRTICSGVRAYFAPGQLLGQQGLFVANLVPRMMMGIPSQGMMLFAEDGQGNLKLIMPAGEVANGSRLR